MDTSDTSTAASCIEGRNHRGDHDQSITRLRPLRISFSLSINNMEHILPIIMFIVMLCLKGASGQEETTLSAHSCIHATRKLHKNGDGTTEESCMSCDPALADCFFNCQDLIDKVYTSCKDVCLPDGYYFDPLSTIDGCFENNRGIMKIKFERCGCNSAYKVITTSWWRLFGALLLAIWTLCMYR